MAEPNTNGGAGAINSKPVLEPITIDGDNLNMPSTDSPTSAGVNPFYEVIPHPDEVHHRNLVLCFDGTGDQFDTDVIFLYVVVLYPQSNKS